jgi:hypothetical protein
VLLFSVGSFLVRIALCGFVGGGVALCVFVSGVALCGFVEGVALCGFVGRVLAVCRFVGWVALLLLGTYGRLRGVGEGL